MFPGQTVFRDDDIATINNSIDGNVKVNATIASHNNKNNINNNSDNKNSSTNNISNNVVNKCNIAKSTVNVVEKKSRDTSKSNVNSSM